MNTVYKRKDCAAHEKLCSRTPVAKTREQKLKELGMRPCSETRCGTCKHFEPDLSYSNYGGICRNPVLREVMKPFPMPWYDAMSVCDFYERKDNNTNQEN